MMAPQRKNKHPRLIVAARIARAIDAGLEPLRVEPPMRMSAWSRHHFYLSRESSQTEGGWDPWPYQVGIMDVISDDDVREVTVMKSARYGYTKILVCGLLYFAEHKKRNQAVWQPTGADAEEFCKVELDPAIRDVPCINAIFPNALRKSKTNTLQLKKFTTGALHIKSGTASGEYRRITVAVGWMDELSKFPQDVEGEGRPFNLAEKRIEGAVFPKIITGSTPKSLRNCQIDERRRAADCVLTYEIPCPHCGHAHSLEFHGKAEKKENRGLVWRENDPESAGHLCPGCGVIYTQSDYLSVWKKGRWIDQNTGVWLDVSGPRIVFRHGMDSIPKPKHVAFRGWSAYSPQITWSKIASEFIAACDRKNVGDDSLLKTFYNITVGECWEEEVEKGDAQTLIRRAENYPLRTVPRDALVLTAFVDVQGDRFELVVWGWGRGEESWVVDYRVIPAINPFNDGDWAILDEYLLNRYPHARGGDMGIAITGIDTGYATHQAYRYCRGYTSGSQYREKLRIWATKGETKEGQPIRSRRTLVDVKSHNGSKLKHGCKLWFIGTDAAKDTFWGRLNIDVPGPGYMHFSKDLPPQFYDQLVSEQRVLRRSGGYVTHKWEKPNSGTRNEVLDCTVGCLWGLEMLTERYHRDPGRLWVELERMLAQPDLIAAIDHTPEPGDEADNQTSADEVPPMPPPTSKPIKPARLRRYGSNWR
jgi:phage terminase large subunit GpA-like protein